jgi:MATE family multidrug resistance protein
VVGVLALAMVLFGRWILPLFTADPAVRSALGTLLPLVALVVVADAVQAVYGFGMLGLRTTLPSLISTALVFGALCLAAVPIADAGGLPALWSALAAANFLQAVTKAALFTRRAARLPAKAAG